MTFCYLTRTGNCNNTGSVQNFDPEDVTIKVQNNNGDTFDYMNKTLHHYLDFLKIKSNPPSDGMAIKINVDIGKSAFLLQQVKEASVS